MPTPPINVPLQLRPRVYPSLLMTCGKHKGKHFDCIIRTDPNYAHWAIDLELTDRCDEPLAIFAHYCLEHTTLAESHKSRPIKKAGGPCDIIGTTFTGTGKNVRTGGLTVDLCAIRALDVHEAPKKFKGYTVDTAALRRTIKMIIEGQLSFDSLSWLWNQDNFLVTPDNEISQFAP